MKKIAGLLMLVIGMSSAAMAAVIAAPEIDPGTGVSAVTLLSGALLVMRTRRK